VTIGLCGRKRVLPHFGVLGSQASGLALIVLPTLVVENELLILACVAAAVGLRFLAHRHGKLQGFVDANKNGADDRWRGGQVGRLARRNRRGAKIDGTV